MTKIKCNWIMCKHNSLDTAGVGDCLATEVVYENKDNEFEHECGNCGTLETVVCDEQLECKTFEWRGMSEN